MGMEALPRARRARSLADVRHCGLAIEADRGAGQDASELARRADMTIDEMECIEEGPGVSGQKAVTTGKTEVTLLPARPGRCGKAEIEWRGQVDLLAVGAVGRHLIPLPSASPKSVQRPSS
jgi:hypothetical protein